jgi:hypothetical protein
MASFTGDGLFHGHAQGYAQAQGHQDQSQEGVQAQGDHQQEQHPNGSGNE